MRIIFRNFIFLCVLSLLAPCLDFGSAAHAAAPAAKLDKADLALLDGGALPDGRILAGVELVLASGVKTYWRMPGDSGLPPVFDFSASQNIAAVEVKWPAPSRYEEADGTILGFKERVIFPFIITPKDKSAPVTLAMTMDFGLCDTLCLPAKAELVRSLSTPGDQAAKAAIGTFLARVPKAGSVGGQAQPSLLSVTSEEKSLRLQLASDTPVKEVILEAAGSWYFGVAALAPDGGGRYRATVAIEQKPSSATLSGLALTVTAIAEGGATETSVTLDASGSIR